MTTDPDRKPMSTKTLAEEAIEMLRNRRGLSYQHMDALAAEVDRLRARPEVAPGTAGLMEALERVLHAKPGDTVAGITLHHKAVSNGHFGWWLSGGGFMSLNNLVAQARASLPVADAGEATRGK